MVLNFLCENLTGTTSMLKPKRNSVYTNKVVNVARTYFGKVGPVLGINKNGRVKVNLGQFEDKISLNSIRVGGFWIVKMPRNSLKRALHSRTTRKKYLCVCIN